MIIGGLPINHFRKFSVQYVKWFWINVNPYFSKPDTIIDLIPHDWLWDHNKIFFKFHFNQPVREHPLYGTGYVRSGLWS